MSAFIRRRDSHKDIGPPLLLGPGMIGGALVEARLGVSGRWLFVAGQPVSLADEVIVVAETVGWSPARVLAAALRAIGYHRVLISDGAERCQRGWSLTGSRVEA